MRTILIVLLLSISVLTYGADYYRLDNVVRRDNDIYTARGGIVIITRYCYHYTYGETAILKWEGDNSFYNSIIWEDETTCQIKKMLVG